MNRSIGMILCLGFCCLAGGGPLAASDTPRFNTMAPMAETFLEMMDAMARAYTDHRTRKGEGYAWRDDDSGRPAAPSSMPLEYFSRGLPSPFQYMPAPAVDDLPPSILEGWWLGESGEVLAFRRDRFRIYLGPREYREGRFRIVDWSLAMENPRDGALREYDYALKDEYLALRDEAGNILYYVRIEP